MNLNYKLFWDANAARKKTSFFLRKTVYHFVEKTWKARYEFPIFLQIGIEVIKRILLCGIVAFLLFIADSWVISHFEIKINDSAFFNFLLSGLSVTGIILGLYCSNIISIFSAVYTNAPDQVSYLFQRDVITNKSINHITATKVFKQWCSMIANRRHDSLGIGARDILETSWELRISNAVENNDHIEYEFGLYGKTIKTNDPLLHAFLTTGFSGFNFHDADEVFLISCLNKYLAPEDRYKSQSNWESRLNNEETNENR